MKWQNFFTFIVNVWGKVTNKTGFTGCIAYVSGKRQDSRQSTKSPGVGPAVGNLLGLGVGGGATGARAPPPPPGRPAKAENSIATICTHVHVNFPVNRETTAYRIVAKAFSLKSIKRDTSKQLAINNNNKRLKTRVNGSCYSCWMINLFLAFKFSNITVVQIIRKYLNTSINRNHRSYQKQDRLT